MDFQAGVDQVERELVRLGEHGLDTQSWFRAADELLDRAVGSTAPAGRPTTRPRR